MNESMAIEIFPDLGEEIIERLKELNLDLDRIKERFAEKDKRISELEAKLKMVIGKNVS